MKVDIQELYEEILSFHWQKLYQLKELIDTNRSNHPLRLKSIRDRENELININTRKSAVELLFEYDITIPDWYNEMIEKIGKVEM